MYFFNVRIRLSLSLKNPGKCYILLGLGVFQCFIVYSDVWCFPGYFGVLVYSSISSYLALKRNSLVYVFTNLVWSQMVVGTEWGHICHFYLSLEVTNVGSKLFIFQFVKIPWKGSFLQRGNHRNGSLIWFTGFQNIYSHHLSQSW